MRRLLAFVAVSAALSGPTFAQQEACKEAPALLAAADLLLREPAEKPKFWRDRYGAGGAYLKMRYGGLDFLAGDALLSSLETRAKPPERGEELRLSHVRTDGRAARIPLIPPTARDGTNLPLLGPSVLRALVLEDGGDWLVGETKRWFDAQPDNPQRFSFAVSVARSVSDAGDDAKEALADKAEAAGVWNLAFAAHAVRDDLSDLVGLLDRAPAGALGNPAGQDAAAFRENLIRFALTIADMRETFDITRQPAEVKTFDAKRQYGQAFRDMYRLTGQVPELHMLLTVLNQTGRIELATELTPALATALAEGKLDPRQPAGVVAAMVDGLDRILGRATREGTLDSFDVTAGPSGFPPEKASAYADRMIARHALAPLVLGKAAKIDAPPALTKAFDWARWHRVAGSLSSGTPIDEIDRFVAADLLVGAARFDEAVAMIEQVGDVVAAQPSAYTLAVSLDRACLGAMKPATPLFDGIYRFFPRQD